MNDTEREYYEKAARFCAYQERAISEVNKRMEEWGASDDIQFEVIRKLIKENFINEKRFAELFAYGKLTYNKWGKNKIKRALKGKDLGVSIIEQALETIEEDYYTEVLTKLLTNKSTQIKAKNDFVRRKKLADFAIGKGFETHLVWDLVKEILP